jgi:hypothetical protein
MVVKRVFGSALGLWSALPFAAKVLILVVLSAAAYFAFTSRRGGGGDKGVRAGRAGRKGRGGAASSPLGPLGPLVREAALSAKQAGAAPTPYQQLLHVQWGLANLQAARRVAAEQLRGTDPAEVDQALSESCGLHVGRLGDYLSRAQRLCTDQIERAGKEAGGGAGK